MEFGKQTMQNITRNNTLTDGTDDKIFMSSISFFVAGGVLFLVTFTFWIVTNCKRRRRWSGAKDRPLPLTPPKSATDVQASGVYLDLQESGMTYDSINLTPGVKQTEFPCYIPRDAMHETFDGSRMPPTNAPEPPSYPPLVSSPEPKVNNSESSPNKDYQNEATRDENDSGYVNQGCHGNDTSHEDSTDVELSYEKPEKSKPITDRPPTIPARRQKKK